MTADTFDPIRYVAEGDVYEYVYRLDYNPAKAHVPERLHIRPADYLTAGTLELYDLKGHGAPVLLYVLPPTGYGTPLLDTGALVSCFFDDDVRMWVLGWDHMLRGDDDSADPHALTGYVLPTHFRGVNTAGLVHHAAERIERELA